MYHSQLGEVAVDSNIETRVMRKVSIRLVPLITVLYFIAYIDRTNLGFAALTMNQALGFSPKVFGFGASLFLVGYVLFQLPGNLLFDKYGARRMTAAIAFLWGLCASGMAWIWDDMSFYTVRLLLGVAEAAFIPGMLYYISQWFPTAYRGRIIAIFMVANPLSNAVGFPLSALLMLMDGTWGIAGWRWVFLLEGWPAVFLSAVVLVYMTERPADARWLSPDERQWLTGAMEADIAARPLARSVRGTWGAFTNLRAWILALGYFCIMIGLYGYNLWLPQIVKKFGLTITATGMVSAIPYLAVAPFMLYWGRRMDKSGDRGWYAASACILGCAGFMGSAVVDSPFLALISLTVAAMGFYAGMSCYWTIVTWLFSGTTAAVCIALVGSVGHLGGIAGSYFMGFMRQTMGNFTLGLVGLGIPLIVAGLIALAFRHSKKEGVPDTA